MNDDLRQAPQDTESTTQVMPVASDSRERPAPLAPPTSAAAQGTTDAAAHMMTKEEAIVRLGALAFAAEDPATLRALLLGCKALARAGIHKRRNKASRIRRKVESAANAAPPRNCDVGTADEQADRFEAECRRHDHCTPCPVHREWREFKEGKTKSCKMIWEQMPFAPAEKLREGGGHANA